MTRIRITSIQTVPEVPDVRRCLRARTQRAPFVILTMESLRRHNTLEPELQPTHRIFLRWAAGSGTGLHDPDAPQRLSHFDPLPNEQAIIVDQLVIHAPGQMPKLIKRWYRTELDTRVIAEELGIGRTQIYERVKQTLWYFRGRFEGCGFDVRGDSIHGA